MYQHIQTLGFIVMVREFFTGMFLAGSDPAVKERLVSRALALPEAIGAALFARLARWDAQYLDTALPQIAAPLLVIQRIYLNPERLRVALQSVPTRLGSSSCGLCTHGAEQATGVANTEVSTGKP